MKFNIRRGFFRIWLILAVPFAICVTIISFVSLSSSFSKYYSFEREYPVNCLNAKGVEKRDYVVRTVRAWEDDGDWTPENKSITRIVCWYGLAQYKRYFRPSYSETDEEIAERLYEAVHLKYSPAPEAPWPNLGIAFLVIVGVPLSVLVLGRVLIWAFEGFSYERKT